MTCTGEKCLYIFGGETGKRLDMSKDTRILLKWIFEKHGEARTGLISLRTGTMAGSRERGYYLRVPQNAGNFLTS